MVPYPLQQVGEGAGRVADVERVRKPAPADWARSNLAAGRLIARTLANSCSNVVSPGRGGGPRSTGSHEPVASSLRASAALNGSDLTRS